MWYNYIPKDMSKLKEYLSKSKARSASVLAILMLFTWYCFFGWKYGFVYNSGPSMLPTFKDKELLVVQRVSTLGGEWHPRKYDAVIVKESWGERLSKRVVAMEGEHVRIKHGKIFIDDEEQKEPYGRGNLTYWVESEEEMSVKPKSEWLFFNIDEDVGVVPEGHVFVIGDNRELSWYGMVKIENITDLIIF